MNALFCVKKQSLDPTSALSTEEVLRAFNNTSDLDEIREAVTNAEDRIYASWASVDVRDRDGERIDIQDIIDDQEVLLRRGGPISDSHTNAIVGKTMAYKVLTHPKSNTLGVMHLNRIFSDNPADDLVWKETVSGERKGSSVGGISLQDRFEIEPDTGEMTRVRENFRQYETANVEDPSNPLSLHEAVSAVAKSYKGNKLVKISAAEAVVLKGVLDRVQKPEELDRMVEAILANPDFKPQEGRTREESAFAIAQSQLGKPVEKQENLYGPHEHSTDNPEGLHTHPENNPELEAPVTAKKSDGVIKENDNTTVYESNSVTKKEGLKMDSEVTKRFEGIEKSLGDISKALVALAPTDEENKEAVAAANEEEPKDLVQKQEEDEKKKEEEKVDKEEDEDKDKVEKEEAAGDIAGLQGKDKPDNPDPDAPNDNDVIKGLQDKLKAQDGKLEKIQKDMVAVQKSTTERPTYESEATKVMKKFSDENSSMAMDIATGKVTKNWQQIHKIGRDLNAGRPAF